MAGTDYDALKYCDLIMKGGIASGVVYPKAITKLAEEYKFASIGGASAGAIAAGLTAAAEYARARGKSGDGIGMAGVGALPETFSKGIGGFFQPVPELKPLFSLARALMQPGKKSAFSFIAAINANYAKLFPATVALPLVLALGFVIWTVHQQFGWAWAVVAGLVGLIFLAAVLVRRVFSILGSLQTDVAEKLPANNYGICSGMTENPTLGRDGLTEWLAAELDSCAALDEGEGPLTFRLLKDVASQNPNRKPINVEMMTTNLSMRRPHRLPMETAIFWFEESEFKALFPDRIVNHMIKIAEEAGQAPRRLDGCIFWPFPGDGSEQDGPKTADDLPVVVAVRMSLSFPILIQAVPLYAEDYSIKFGADGNPLPTDRTRPLELCLFTDGGVSSNFPMHFFDKPLPGTPTFGISLSEFDVRRSDSNRVWRPVKPGDGLTQRVMAFDGLAGFLMRIVDTSKDWQDSLLSRLPGYRERVATISLDAEEGGLNLDMDQATILRMAGYGEQAGVRLRELDLDEHRWRRFLTTYDKLTDWIDDIDNEWTRDGASYKQLLADYPHRKEPGPTYFGSARQSAATIKEMTARLDALSKLAATWRSGAPKPEKGFPKPASELQIRPRE